MLTVGQKQRAKVIAICTTALFREGEEKLDSVITVTSAELGVRGLLGRDAKAKTSHLVM